MMRTVLAATAVLAVAAVGWGQEKKPEADAQKERGRAEQEYRKERAAFFRNIETELPDLARRLADDAPQPPRKGPKEVKDTPVVRAGKRALRAEQQRYELIETRISAGQFSGSSQYIQLTECVVGVYSAATLIWDDPEDLLPFAEDMVVSLLKAEAFNAPRVSQGIEEPQLGPQLTAARCKAEAVVLKLREKAKK